MSKKLSLLISPIFISCLLLGCSKQIPEVYKHKDNTDPITIYGKEIKLSFTTEQYDKDVEFIEALLASIKEGKDSYQEISKKIKKFYAISEKAESEYRKATLLADMTVKDEDIVLADTIYAATVKFTSYVTKIVLAIYESNYKNDYFKGMSEQEIEDYMKGFDETTSDVISEAKTRLNNIRTQYFTKELDVYEAVRQYVSTGNQIATVSGYDNYMEYQYEKEYFRQYTPSDTANLIDYVREYIYPIHLETYTYFTEEANKLNDKELERYYEILYGCFTHELDLFGKYAKDLGGQYYSNFNYLFNSGNYFMSEVVNANTTAYNWDIDGEPFVFFGGSYQDVCTLAHEFGHYNAAVLGSSADVSYDLCEVHSQGSEAMFYNYLRNNAKDNKKAFDILFANRIDSLLSNVYTGVMINELESQLYSAENIATMSNDDITKIVTDILSYLRKGEEGISTNIEAILDICLVSPIYYISYSTSAVASLELMAAAYNDYNTAKGMYKKIYANYSNNDKINDFQDVMNYAGLSNVFEEQAHQNIHTFVDSFLKSIKQ